MEVTTKQDELCIVSDAETMLTSVFYDDQYMFSFEAEYTSELHRELVSCLDERDVEESLWQVYYACIEKN
ncbi:TPA: hypothetical protein JG855_002042 [Vibrio parahaemolyticus]|uniref:hypothetical protein n=1 Tax=Vibrio TaxID=662 RepID=UPI001EEBC1C5|nr:MULTISPECIES: hypothetical protein [Vibrio]HAV1497952.1 hypothetical protein [Vibrio parahaemolyticus]MCG6354805.1 hypothetical protein [Vibrio alginolyticus]MCK8112517.1 hypothetical protein [Vibrio sp. 2CM40D]MDW1533309.1 hypothetical protein [Vibrio sp. Y159]HAV1503121.1 hypothetical protein [Vibrio parahaemolyticus]